MSIFNYISKGTLARFVVGFVNGIIGSIYYHKIISLQFTLGKQRILLLLGFLLYILVSIVVFRAIAKK